MKIKKNKFNMFKNKYSNGINIAKYTLCLKVGG